MGGEQAAASESNVDPHVAELEQKFGELFDWGGEHAAASKANVDAHVAELEQQFDHLFHGAGEDAAMSWTNVDAPEADLEKPFGTFRRGGEGGSGSCVFLLRSCIVMCLYNGRYVKKCVGIEIVKDGHIYREREWEGF